MTPRRTLYMVGNAHIDPVWLWQWQEGLQEVRATFRSALDLMEEFEDFVFTCDSVAYLEWVQQSDPELWERVRQRARQGRFVVVGGWWIEPDCNIPHGESLVRQALYAQHFLEHHFGKRATVGCNVDSFGHPSTLPQLLAKAGLSDYVFLRPEPHEKALPGELFWWESPEGSRTLAYRIPHGYTSPHGELDRFVQDALAKLPDGDGPVMIFYGVGNHGGGPTRADLHTISTMKAAAGLPLPVLAGPGEYFGQVRDDAGIPTYRGDLHHHARGCYSAHSGVKRWNRKAEHLLIAAEKWATVAHLALGAPYPHASLTAAWKHVLFNQFHDILAGTAIAPAYEDARDQYGYACTVAAQTTNLALQTLASKINLPSEEGSITYVVANPHPWPVQADVELEVEGTSTDEVAAYDEETQATVPVQQLRSLATLGGRHRRLAIATDLPPLGYRAYRLRPKKGDLPAQSFAPSAPATQPVTLQNDYLKLVLDPSTGSLASLVDKTTGIDVLRASRTGHAIAVEDLSDTWGHDISRFGEEVGKFRCTSVRIVQRGSVRTMLEVESEMGRSRLSELIILGARSRFVEVRVFLDWHERQRALKLRFPVAVDASDTVATFSEPYGRATRPRHGTEEVGQAWVDISGTSADGRSAGLAVVNDAKYAYDVAGTDLGITVARSPVFAWHDPHELDPQERYHYLDQGCQEFTYALVPHAGDLVAAGVPRVADLLNQPPVALPEHFHPGALPPTASFADDGQGSVQMTVLKRAEDGNGTIVRAYETSGATSRARLDIGVCDRSVEANFAGGEVKTFLFPDNPLPGEEGAAPPREVSLLEGPWPFP